MDRLIEFSANHWELVTLFVGLLITFFLLEGRRGGKAISPQQTVALMNREEAVILDVRDRKQVEEGTIVGAINIPYTSIAERAGELERYRSQTLIVVDQMGQHASSVVRQLRQKGFTTVQRMAGGIVEWKSAGLPLKRATKGRDRGSKGKDRSRERTKTRKANPAVTEKPAGPEH